MNKYYALLAMAILAVSAAASSDAAASRNTDVYLQVDSYLSVDNVPTQVTIIANTQQSGGKLYGETPINYTAHANVGWTLSSSIVAESGMAALTIVPAVSAPDHASGSATAGTNGNVTASCTVPLTHGPITEANALKVAVVTLTIAAN